MWAPKRLDIDWGDLAYACLECLRPRRSSLGGEEVARGWFERGHALACLSVRSGLDLLLAALALPQGSEVLMSAINIPDMASIIRRHGLVVVPVDVDRDTLHVSAEGIRKLLSHQTRIILIAHLFGRRADLDEIAALAERHNLLLVEDCAQTFSGRSFTAHAASDAALFSFGPIKTATALGGAVVRVKDRILAERMRALQEAYKRQPRWQYFARVFKFAALKLLTTRRLYGVFVHGIRRLGLDHDRFIHGRLRSFGSDADLLRAIRRRPCEPLLRMLRRRIQGFDDKELAARTANALRLAETIVRRGAATIEPQPSDTYWVFPHPASDKHALSERLLAQGFDIARTSSLVAIQPDAPHHPRPRLAEELIESLVFLPAYKEMPPEEIDRLAEQVAAAERGTPTTDRVQSTDSRLRGSRPKLDPAARH
jgi:dTDP-4-amino-4,6-dideoxygalactose transaminase